MITIVLLFVGALVLTSVTALTIWLTALVFLGVAYTNATWALGLAIVLLAMVTVEVWNVALEDLSAWLEDRRKNER